MKRNAHKKPYPNIHTKQHHIYILHFILAFFIYLFCYIDFNKKKALFIN